MDDILTMAIGNCLQHLPEYIPSLLFADGPFVQTSQQVPALQITTLILPYSVTK